MTQSLETQMNVARTRLEASRVCDHKLYLHSWLMSLPSIQVAELRRLFENQTLYPPGTVTFGRLR